jgi:hypothetical protein
MANAARVAVRYIWGKLKRRVTARSSSMKSDQRRRMRTVQPDFGDRGI